MTREDFVELQRLAGHVPDTSRLGVLSPLREGERKIFPNATAIPRWRWNLNRPGRRRFDLLVASNVFMYSADPERWLGNVLPCCRFLVLLDLVRRQRSRESEFGCDGDCMRYAVGEAQPRVDTYFDLAMLGDRLLGYRTYDGGANEFDNAPLHFVALVRGDLSDPDARPDLGGEIVASLWRPEP